MRFRAERLTAPVLLLGLGLFTMAMPGIARDKAPPPPATGPAADYPIVLGPPYSVNGVTYTPADKLNFDQVGYAEIDPSAGGGISIAHRTLPLPSYVEITSLLTGRTILVRVERRGPLSGTATAVLSPGAAAQLGTADSRTPVRIRRVNPSEPERAQLRLGQRAPERMDTPMSLVAVLMRKLDPSAPFVAAPAPPRAMPQAGAAPVPTGKQPAVMPVVLKPASPPSTAATQPAARSFKPAAEPAPVPTTAVQSTGASGLVVQVGAFSNRANAAAVAARVGGAVSPTGRLFRVRLGGFASAAQASAALAKVRAAGYSEARIQHVD